MRRIFASAILLFALAFTLVVPAAAQMGVDRATQVRQRAEAILQSSEFNIRPHEKGVMERIGDFLRDIWAKIVKFLNGLGFSPSASPGMSQFIYFLVMTVMIVLGAMAIAWLILRLSSRFKVETIRPARPGATFEELADISTPAELLKQAEQLAAQGQFRGAYRLAFLASLKQLDVVGALRFDSSRTNGEVVRHLRSKRPLYALMRPASLDFDKRWYGGEDVGEEDFKRIALLPKQIEQASPA